MTDHEIENIYNRRGYTVALRVALQTQERRLVDLVQTLHGNTRFPRWVIVRGRRYWGMTNFAALVVAIND